MLTKNDLSKIEEIIDIKMDRVIEEIKVVIEMVGEVIGKLDKNIQETQGHRIAIGSHEQRIQGLETKVFSPV